MKIYPIKSRSARISTRVTTLVHIDSYRLRSSKDLVAISVKEYLGKPNVVTIIEWADKIKKILPKKTIFVNISNLKNNKREIKI